MSAKLKASKKDSALPTQRLKEKQKHSMLARSRIIGYGVRNFTRNAWLTVAATAVMTITLLIVFATIVITHMLNSTVISLREKIDISIYLKPETSDDTLQNLKGVMQLTDNVRSVSISNSQQQYESYIDSVKSDSAQLQAISSLSESGIDPAASFSAVMHVKVDDLNNLDPIKDTVNNTELFQEWLDPSRDPSYDGDQRGTIQKISSWATFAQKIGFFAGIIFMAISILVIFNTIRMAIFSRRDEIEMMKSVGASKFFIRGPFLVEAEMYGLLAAILATTIGYLLFMWITPGLESYGVSIVETQSLMSRWYWAIALVIALGGVLIGYVSAWLATRRYLK